MVNIASLLISFSADIKGLRNDFKKVRKEVGGLSKGFKLAGAAIGALVGARVVSQIKNSIVAFARYNDTLAKTAKRLGVSAQFLEEFRFAAQRSGVDMRAIDIGLQRVNRRLGELARTGGGEASSALRDLGDDIFLAARRGATFEELLPKIADRLKAMTSQTERLSIAQKLFDSEGVAFLNLLQEGSEGVEKLTARYRGLAGVLEDDLLEQSERFNDAILDISTAFKGLVRTIGPDLLEFLAKVIEDITVLVALTREMISQANPATPFERLQEALKNLDVDALSRGISNLLNVNRVLIAQVKEINERATRINNQPFVTSHQKIIALKTTNLEMRTLNEELEKNRELLLKAADALATLTQKREEDTQAAKNFVSDFQQDIEDRIKALGTFAQQASTLFLDLISGVANAFGQAIAQMVVQGKSAAEILNSLITQLLTQLLAKLIAFVIEVIALNIAQLVTNVIAAESKSGIIGVLVAVAAVGGLVALMLATSRSQSKRASSGVSSAQEGGLVTETGLVNVHAGEVIGDLDAVLDKFAPAGGMQMLNVIFDRRTVAQAAFAGMPRELNMRVGNF